MSLLSRKDALYKMLENDPNDLFINYAIALEYEKEGKVELAKDILFELKSTAPEYLALYLKLAMLCVQLNKKEAAINVINDGIVIAIKQNNKKAERELKEMLLSLED